MQESTFNELADLALRTTGQHIPVSKSYLMEARLSSISRRENFATLDDLVHCLKARPNQRFEQEIAAALTSKRTHFFREREQLEFIVSHALPQRLKQSKNGRLRVWCAGVSTGQDAWSLAMRLREEVGSPLASADIEIVGTDISTECVETGTEGTYGHYDVQKGLSIHRLMTNFTRGSSGDWTINKDLRGERSVPPPQFATPGPRPWVIRFDLMHPCHQSIGPTRAARRVDEYRPPTFAWRLPLCVPNGTN